MVIFVEKEDFIYVIHSLTHTYSHTEKISGRIQKNRKETEWLGNKSVSEICFSPYTCVYLLNFESSVMMPIKIIMINVIGKFTRTSSAGSIFYRKNIEDDFNIYQQGNDTFKVVHG